MARDSYSYLHFLMVAGIVLVALGMKKILGDVDEPLKRSRRSRCSAGWPSTCSDTSPSASATCTRSTVSGSVWQCC